MSETGESPFRFEELVSSRDDGVYEVRTRAPGPDGQLALEAEEVVGSPRSVSR